MSVLDQLKQLFDIPLYEGIELPEPTPVVRGLKTTKFKLDRFCPSCGRSTTWTAVPLEADLRASREERSPPHNWLGDFKLTFVCARMNSHTAELFVRVKTPTFQERFESDTEGTPLPPVALIKIGQFPSLTDFQLGDLSELEEGLTTAQRREFVRAINCAAHGFNVAACVHYRRVFEGVLAEARDKKMKSESLASWPEFVALRTAERVSALRGYIPDFMADHPHLYSILSLGVHELTEDQCGKALPTLRQAIELMVHERADAARRAKRRDAVSKLLAQTVDEHKK